MAAVFENADFVFLTETRTDTELCLDAYGIKGTNYTHTLPDSLTKTVNTGGIAFCVRANLAHAIHATTLFAPSMLHVHVKGQAINLDRDLHLIGAYMLHEKSKQRDPNAWSDLAAKVESLPKEHYVMLLGDLNAHIADRSPRVCVCGYEKADESDLCTSCVCERTSEDTKPVDAYGDQLLDLCTSMNMCVLNCLVRVNDMHFSFNHSDCMTFSSKGGNGSSVVDYMCMDARLLSRLRHFTVCTDLASAASDHYLLACYISNPPRHHSAHHRLTTQATSRKIKWSDVVHQRLCEALPDDAVFSRTVDFFKQSYESHQPVTHSDLQQQYSQCIDSIRKCATGRPPVPPQRPTRAHRHASQNRKTDDDGPAYIAQTKWYDGQCFHLRRVHRTLLRKAVRATRQGKGTHAVEVARQALKQYLSVCRRKRKDWLKSVTEQVDSIVQAGNNKTWQYVDEILSDKRRTDVYAPPISALTAHFTQVFSPTPGQDDNKPGKMPSPEPPARPNTHTIEHVTVSDVEQVLAKVKRDKAGGWDGIPSALLADLKESEWFVSLVHCMCNVFVRNAFWPEQWNAIIIAPIPKSGKPPDKPDSYRPIHLICVLAKCVSSLVERKIRASVETCCEQLGFQTGSGTRDNVFVLHQLIRKYRKRRLFTCFVDFKMAFDSVDRDKLFDKLEQIPGMDTVWLRMLKAMYKGVKASVKGSGVWFPETIGVKQGDPLSPLLFILYINDLTQALVPTDGDGNCSKADQAFVTTLSERLIRCLLYADDLALPSRTEAGLSILLDRLRDYCNTWKLTVNVSKTEVVVFDSSRKAEPLSTYKFYYNSELIKCVDKFKYVGIWFHRSGRTRDTFSDMLGSSRRAMFKCMGRVVSLGPVPVCTKITLFNAYVRPVMLYCAEALPLTRTQTDALDALQMQYVRWCLGRLPQSSTKVDTLAEVGQRPISYEVSKASINYCMLVKSRTTKHITTAALGDALAAKEKQENWWRMVQGHLGRMGCDEEWHETLKLRLDNCREQARKQKAIASQVRMLCADAWKQQLLGPPPETPDWCSHHDTVSEWMDTYVLPVHVTDNRGGRWYRTHFPPQYKLAAPYVKSCMSSRLTRAICMFRLGIAQLHAHTGNWGATPTHLFARTCTYCQHACQRACVEDAYHVCMECPLYEHMRVGVYTYLYTHKFDFTPFSNLQALYIALLSVPDARAMRAIGGFLSDCLAARDLYLNPTKESKWITAERLKHVKDCVAAAPTDCKASNDFLKETAESNCHESTATQLSTHLANISQANRST